MKRRLTVLIPLLYLIVTGCSLAPIEAYPGPDLPEERLALIIHGNQEYRSIRTGNK